MLQLSDAVAKANFECTVVHVGQTEQWFKVWGAKADAAHTIIVVFDKHYKVNSINTLLRYGQFACFNDTNTMETNGRGKSNSNGF